ncbi:uncharacterized protein LOC132306059 [Cornus florida]|uniref:uncharacterized protein LOC132306059 n=1 Tax=Cornus florida TaxID=4283 RepID=UPI00289DAF54|nr:uncharacterized protein LOC132306059 [Cornus florida]
MGIFYNPERMILFFRKWRTENAVVKGWLINSMDPKLIGNYIRFPTAKAVWDAIATTYFDGADTSQVYDLKRKVTRLKQGGGSIETYYNNLQGLWREIDFRCPNPMQCEIDIQRYNSILQEDRVYTFLDGLDDHLDKIRGDVLQIQPFPTVEQAYAHVRREDLRQAVMLTKGDTTPSAVMLSKGGQKSQQQPSLQILSNGKLNTWTKSKSQAEGGGCTHCETHGRVALVNTKSQLSLIPQEDSFPAVANKSVALNDPGQATKELNCCALMYPSFCLFQDILTKEIIGRGTKRGGLYYMNDLSFGRANNVHRTGDKERQIWLWHRRLGHPSFSYLKRLCPNDCTRMTWLYVMKNKNEVFGIFRSFHNMIKTQFSAKLQILRSDNGGEYDNNELREYFQAHGLCHETTCSQTPQQNGVAERKSRHILETARAFLTAAHAPRRYWADVVGTAVYLLNQMPSRVLDFETPLQALAHHVSLPSVLMLPPRIFGCLAYVHLHKNQRTKLDVCAVHCVFLGYATHKKGYRCYDPTTKCLYTMMDVTFLESETFFSKQGSHSSLQGELLCEEQNVDNWENWPGFEDTNLEVNQIDEIQLRYDDTDLVGTLSFPEASIEQGEENDDAKARSEQKQTTEQEQPTPHSLVPNDHSPENTPEVQSLNSSPSNTIDDFVGYKLPFRYNRGKPPNRYSPDHGEKKKKYPIANHICT